MHASQTDGCEHPLGGNEGSPGGPCSCFHTIRPEHGFIGIVRSKALWASEFLALNDRVEFVYAMSAIWDEALAQALPKIPEDLRDPAKTDAVLRGKLPEYIDGLRKQVEQGDGYGSVYVTSFARGRSEDEDEHGILTLWDRYTGNKGYCVQFEKERVREFVRSEQHCIVMLGSN